MLADDRPDPPRLTEVHRFTQSWEAEASVQLRAGKEDAINAYLEHDRVHSGGRDQMVNDVVHAWHTPIADGHSVGLGDRVVTRHNDRRLTAGDHWVKNGDMWTITSTHSDGALTVSDTNERSVRLPVDYVRDHVELGYATTVHRAQGRTVDTAHALIDDNATRESLYVAITRARTGNHTYLAGPQESDIDDFTDEHTTSNDRDRLTHVLGRAASEASAHAYLETWKALQTPDPINIHDSRSQWVDPALPPQGIRF
jgi:hypothetical protein